MVLMGACDCSMLALPPIAFCLLVVELLACSSRWPLTASMAAEGLEARLDFFCSPSSWRGARLKGVRELLCGSQSEGAAAALDAMAVTAAQRNGSKHQMQRRSWLQPISADTAALQRIKQQPSCPLAADSPAHVQVCSLPLHA